ncbi:MAG: hypothetical protein EXR97_03830 [Nitrospiraceae bacterium]|nr:hypothetical protein [Nitrospiraceae bacterium]MSR25150.1 hypothetical protein [Nitrospiraceae bacterium]
MAMHVLLQRPIVLVLLLSLFLCIPGCPIRWQRITLNHPIKADDVSFIVPGQTTLKQVLEKLGVPDQIEHSTIGPITSYDFLDVKEFKVDLLSPLPLAVSAAAVIPGSYRQLELQSGGIGPDHFRVFFDSNWIVQSYAFEIHPQATEYMLWPF